VRVADWPGLCLVAALILGTARVGMAAQSGDVIVIGAAVSLTGKYAQNGNTTKNGYDLAARLINDEGGIKIGDREYKLVLRYYDGESTRHVPPSSPSG
jgi:branched-chain amino acid transport system substrate-binding protein